MMKVIKISILISSLCFALSSCNRTQEDESMVLNVNPDSLKEHLDYAHQALNEHEEKVINQFLKRHQWKMERTSTGLRYVVYRPGQGTQANKGDMVRFNYELKLINGIVIDSSDESGVAEIVIEYEDVVSGLHEVLQYMNTGARAKAIIPSYLAYGLTGDLDRIPKGATLVYDIEILKIVPVK